MKEKKKNNSLIPKSDLREKMISFNEKMKKHLSNELMYLTDQKDDLENQIFQLKIEKEQKDKTLFQHIDNKDIRKYFSPLNLADMEENKKDDKQKEISGQIKYIQESIEEIDKKIEEIKELLYDMDEMIQQGFQKNK